MAEIYENPETPETPGGEPDAEQPEGTTPPTGSEQPAGTTPPTGAEQPASAEPPAGAEQPASAESPAGAEQPVSEEPAASPRQPASAEPPPSAVPPVNAQPVETSEEVNKDARMWAMFCHLAGLAGFVVPVILSGIIAPLIIWQIKKDDHPFIDENGKEALNFQISIGIYAFVSIPLIFVFCIGAFLLTAVEIFNLVFLLIAAVKANNGFLYRYPLCIRFIK